VLCSARPTLPGISSIQDFRHGWRAAGAVLDCVPDMASVRAACISENYNGSSAGIFNPARPKADLPRPTVGRRLHCTKSRRFRRHFRWPTMGTADPHFNQLSHASVKIAAIGTWRIQ